MKFLFTLILILSYAVIQSQENNLKKKDSIIYTIRTCEQGANQSKEDFNNKIYNSFSYGLVFNIDVDFSSFYQVYMKSNYNINIKNKGCVTSSYSKCYSQEMKDQILEKFGTDVFEKSRKEARVLYDKTKK